MEIKLIEAIYHDSLSMGDLLIEGQKIISEFFDILKKESNIFLKIEESKYIKRLYNQLHDKCIELSRVNSRMKYFVENTTEKPDLKDIEWLIDTLNNLDIPSALKILKLVFSSSFYDESDREIIYKECQIFDYLLGFFTYYVNELSIKYIRLKNKKVNTFIIPKIKEYELPQEEIEQRASNL